MVTLKIVNLTASDVKVDDLGIVVPASGEEGFSDARSIREVVASASLRSLILAGTVKLNDGTSDIGVETLYNYWLKCGFENEKMDPPSEIYIKASDGSRWKITVDGKGVISTTAM